MPNLHGIKVSSAAKPLHGMKVPGHPNLQYWGPNGYIRVRIVVPAELRTILGSADKPKHELVKGLGTACVSEAVRRSHAVIAEFQRQIDEARGRLLVPLLLPARQINRAMMIDAIRMERERDGIARDELLRRLDNAYGERTIMLPSAEAARLQQGEPMVDVGVADHYSYETGIIAWVASRGEHPPEDSTVDVYTAHLKRLFDRLGHDDMRRVSDTDILDHPQALLTGSDGGLRLRNKSVNNHMASIRAVFRVAKFGRKIDTDPTVGTVSKLIVKRNPETDRKGFSREDHARIFAEAMRSDRPAIKWLWAIGCTSGARIGEIADATVGAIRQVGGIWCIDINESYRGWRVRRDGTRVRISLKTEGSPRVLPLHSAVLNAGFLAYVESVSNGDPDAPLFPSLNLNRYGKRSDNASELCNKWLDDVIGLTDRRLVFHSSRHAIKTYLAGRVEDRVSNAITGHDDGTVANDYGETEIVIMRDAIELIGVGAAAAA
jgi:integrase